MSLCDYHTQARLVARKLAQAGHPDYAVKINEVINYGPDGRQGQQELALTLQQIMRQLPNISNDIKQDMCYLVAA